MEGKFSPAIRCDLWNSQCTLFPYGMHITPYLLYQRLLVSHTDGYWRILLGRHIRWYILEVLSTSDAAVNFWLYEDTIKKSIQVVGLQNCHLLQIFCLSKLTNIEFDVLIDFLRNVTIWRKEKSPVSIDLKSFNHVGQWCAGTCKRNPLWQHIQHSISYDTRQDLYSLSLMSSHSPM